MVLGWVGTGNVAKQTQSSYRRSRSDWRLVGSVPYFIVGHVGCVLESVECGGGTLVKCIVASAGD